MQILHDYYVVAIDKLYDDSASPSGIVTLNAAYINEEADDRFVHKRIYGTVLGVPETFSDTIVELVDPGFPPARTFVGGDYLQMRANQGYDGRAYKPESYICSTVERYDAITLQDVAKKLDVKLNERAYFDYNVTEPENLLGKFKGQDLYKVRADEIYCVAATHRKHMGGGGSRPPVWQNVTKIRMQGGWVLVKPRMETWAEITTPSGIIMKPNPEARQLEGTIEHIRFRKDLRKGDRIVFTRHADAILNVEGEPYYCMHESDVLAKF